LKIALLGEIFGNVRLGKFLESVRLGKFLESVRLGKLLESVRLGKFYGKKSAGAQIFDFSGRFCTSDEDYMLSLMHESRSYDQ
jgi:hypothetical protein